MSEKSIYKLCIRRWKVKTKNWHKTHLPKYSKSLWTKAVCERHSRDYGLMMAETFLNMIETNQIEASEVDVAFIDAYIDDEISCWA